MEETSLLSLPRSKAYHLGIPDSKATIPCEISCPWLKDWTSSLFPKNSIYAGLAH